MAGYLEQYGAGDEKREKTIRRLIVWTLAAALVAGILLVAFHNYSEQHRVKRFFALLASHDYNGAYALWGCTAAKPCPEYPISAFMQDWGPQTVSASNATVLDGESCGSGVIVDVDTGRTGDKKIWVERSTNVLGFPPFDQCPQRNRIADFYRGIKYRLHGHTYKP